MKRTVSILIALLLVLALVGCSTAQTTEKLSGKASRIDFVDGWKIGSASFEYVNEHTVKIVRDEDNQVFYVPINSIDMIWVEGE